MLSILKRLFGNNSPQHTQTVNDFNKPIFSKTIACLTLDPEEEVPMNQWYRKSHWKSEHFLRMETSWDADWKNFEAEENVVGTSFDSRMINFLRLCDQPQFRIFLKKDKSNMQDPNAIKVMGSAIIEDKFVVEQLGFLSKHTALQLKDEDELDARPHSVYLPVHGHSFGLRIRVLVRSHKYRKRKYGDSAIPVPKKVQWEPDPWTKEDDENLEEIYEYFADKDFRKENYIKKPSKKMIKEAAKALHEKGIASSSLTIHIDSVVEMIIELNPDIEIEY